MEPLKLSITQIVEWTHECRAVIFDAIAAGHLKTFLVGRRRFARPAEVRKWVDYLEKRSEQGKPVTYRRKVAGGGLSAHEASQVALAARQAKRKEAA